MALTAKQKKFIDEYIRCGNATEAARLSGYKQPHVQGYQNLEKLRDFIEQRNSAIEDASIADMAEINRFWTGVLRDENADMKDRLKASELRAKVQGAFIEKVEHSGTPSLSITVDYGD